MKLLTSGVVARELGVDDETVRRWCRAGELKATLLLNQWAIVPEDLETFRAGNRPYAKPPTLAERRQRRAEAIKQVRRSNV